MAPPYLCQVGQRVSCAACCGLYNVRDLSADSLETLLNARTDAFDRVPRQAEAIEDFGRQQLGWTPEDRPFPHFYHCPYVGLFGRRRTRVGCLLHPDEPGNHGRDWRELSYYGAQACRTYFCPTTERLAATHQEILCAGIDHWYLYGVTITEHRLWRAFFEGLERRLGRPLKKDDFEDRTEAQAKLRAFAVLKLDWPFRQVGAPGPCHFFFDDTCYPRLEVVRVDPAIPLSPFEAIFRELESRFVDTGDLQRAEAMVTSVFDELAAVISD